MYMKKVYAFPGGEDPHRYEDMLLLPHHQSAVRPHMSMRDRAAQFSPFAALTGYEEVIDETARLTDRRLELSEEERSRLDEALAELEAAMKSHDHPGEQPDLTGTAAGRGAAGKGSAEGDSSGKSSPGQSSPGKGNAGPTARITWFIPDTQKAGGRYASLSGRIIKIDHDHRCIHMNPSGHNVQVIPMDEISGIENM